MTTEQTELYYSKLLELLNFNVQNAELRSQLLTFLASRKGEIILAPASSRHHHAEPGGLLRHIVEVTQLGIDSVNSTATFCKSFMDTPKVNQMREDLVVAAILHDIHKLGDPWGRRFYEPKMVKASRKKDEMSYIQSKTTPYERNENAYNMAGILNRPVVGTTDEDQRLRSAVAWLVAQNYDDMNEGSLSLFYVSVLQPPLYTLLNDEVKYAVKHHDGAYATSGFKLAGKETPVMLALHHGDMVSSRADRWKAAPAAETEDEIG